jgi:hypothetical protein
MQIIEYRVTIRVPDEPLLDDVDKRRVERGLHLAIPASWGVEVDVTEL